MIEFVKPTSKSEYKEIKRLYKSAFPKNERKPFSLIKKMHKGGITDIWYFREDGEFLGLAITINREDCILVDYFAVIEEKRGRGRGTEMLKELIGHYSPRGLFLEIERPYENQEGYLLKVRRKSFYLNAGLVELGVYICLFGVDMELLGVGIDLTFEEYKSFYLDRLSLFAPRVIFEKNIIKIN